MRRECRECFPRHRLQRKPLVSDHDMHHGTCVAYVPWCMSGSLIHGGGENVPGIPGACATHNFTYLARGPLQCMTALPLIGSLLPVTLLGNWSNGGRTVKFHRKIHLRQGLPLIIESPICWWRSKETTPENFLIYFSYILKLRSLKLHVLFKKICYVSSWWPWFLSRSSV